MGNPCVLPIVTALCIAGASSCFADAIAPPKQPATPQQTALDDIKQLKMSMFGIYDATFQNEGDVTQGRATIEANLVRLMAKLPTGTRLEDRATSSRVIAPDVIACQGISHRIASDGTSTEMYFIRVLVRQGDRWLLAATQIARPSTLPKSSPQPK